MHGNINVLDLYDGLRINWRWLGWLQIGVWLAGLTCRHWFRLRKCGAAALTRLVGALAIAALLPLLYAFCIEDIGESLLYERVFNKLF